MSPCTLNLFLSSLSDQCRDALISDCVAVDLPIQKVLHEPGETPRYIYFLHSGMASVVTQMSDGDVAEVGSIGREGVVGSVHLLGAMPLSTCCIMEFAGNGLRIPFAVFQTIFNTSDEVRRHVLEFVQEQVAISEQIAGCNRMHNAEQRLVRWLLTAQDLTQSDPLRFTHQNLAVMIGVQRSTISVIAAQLQFRDLIRYSRGVIRFLDRPGLEAIVCGCYPIVKNIYSSLYGQDDQGADQRLDEC